jgi:hypothetical protein
MKEMIKRVAIWALESFGFFVPAGFLRTRL